MSVGWRIGWLIRSVVAASGVLVLCAARNRCGASEASLSPAALAATPNEVFIACATGGRVLRFDITQRKVTASYSMPAPPSGLAVSADGKSLFVTCAGPASQVCVLDLAAGKVSATLAAGHTAMAPVLSPDGKTLFVCNRFNDDISVLDLASGHQRGRIPVQREPTAAALTHDGRFLLVANHLPRGGADVARVAAVVSVIDTAANRVVKELVLPDGSHSLNDLRVSPDGRYAVVTHILSRFRLPATQLDRGWMNTNAGTIIDLAKMEIVDTVLLDNVERGAANPWGVAWSGDSTTLVVTHAGTHELSFINFSAVLAKLAKLPARLDQTQSAGQSSTSSVQSDVRNDLSFLVGMRQRLKLPPGQLGPRAVVVVGRRAFVANYFSDTLCIIRLDPGDANPADAAHPAGKETLAPQSSLTESVPLGPKTEMSLVRKGEFYFNDAGLCFQGWQSCATCHPGDGRADGLNWDLLNDGIGNPKNTKSLLLAHRTPPAMSMGVRETAEMAVRAGLRYILFTVQPEEVPTALDAYLKSLKPLPSPYLVAGRLSASAHRGEKLFSDRRVGCATCHPPGLFTSLKSYDVGTRGRFDKPADRFDAPTLVEAWRTAPYLHDGSAATLREVLTTHNPHDDHGTTSHLTPSQIDDLAAYVLSQ